MKRKTPSDRSPAMSPTRRKQSTAAGASSRPSRRRYPKASDPKTPRLAKVLKLLPPPELAKVCGVARTAVHQWRDLPPRHALAVEKATGGKLTKEYLAPNFYPRPAA